MKPVNVLLCCALSAVAGALLCYAVLRTSGAAIGPAAAGPENTPPVSSPVDRLPNDARAAAVAGDRAASQRAANAGGAASDVPTGGASTASGTALGDQRVRGAPRASGAGPMPISDENLRRADGVIAEMRLHDSDLDDLYTLLDTEGRDAAWSDAAEAQLVAFLRTHGGGYDGLEVKPPRCSASVCEMIAVAQPGLGTDAANANWQALLGELFGQTWFGNTFDSQSMGVMPRDGSAVYVSTFLRKAPAP